MSEFSIPQCPLIEVSGPARDRGRQYGEQATTYIEKGIAHYMEQITRSGLSTAALDTIIARFASAIEDFEPSYLDEIHGIAEGAGVTFADVMILNARTEILKMARRREKGVSDFIEPDGCTGVIALPTATADGKLIHAQNWDWKAECAQTSIVLKVRRDDGPDLLTFTEAGGLARAGFNSVGTSITGNYLESDRDYQALGVPLAVIRRRVLEQAPLAISMLAIHATRKSASNNLMVANSKGFAIDFECVPDETFHILPDNGLLVHANHFQSPVALAKLRDMGIMNMPDSLYRDVRVRELLAPVRDSMTVDDVKSALFDDFETPWAVCRPPRKSFSNNLSATVAMIVMVPEDGRMDVAMLPALNRTFQSYQLEMEAAPVKTVGHS